MLIDCGDLREKYGPLMKMNDAYDWADNAVRCYDQVVETLCEQHLDERFPGKTAKQWQAVTLKALITVSSALGRHRTRGILRSTPSSSRSPRITNVLASFLSSVQTNSKRCILMRWRVTTLKASILFSFMHHICSKYYKGLRPNKYNGSGPERSFTDPV